MLFENSFWHNWQDKPHRYYLSLGLSYRRQTQGCSENCEEYMNMIWSPPRWCIQGRKRPPHSARTQRVSTRRTSSTSQPTSRWTSWVFVFSCKDLFENAYRWSGCCWGGDAILNRWGWKWTRGEELLLLRTRSHFCFSAECCDDVPYNKGKIFLKQELKLVN